MYLVKISEGSKTVVTYIGGLEWDHVGFTLARVPNPLIYVFQNLTVLLAAVGAVDQTGRGFFQYRVLARSIPCVMVQSSLLTLA